MSENKPVLDPETIEKLRSLNRPGKKYLVAELGELFFQDSPALLDTASEALASKDFEVLYKAVHRLKGSALYRGGTELGDLCQRIMAAARAEDSEGLAAEIQKLRPAYDRLSEALNQEIEQGLPG